MLKEQVRDVRSGYGVFVVLLTVQLVLGYGVFRAALAGSLFGLIALTLLSALALVLWFGFFLVHPNEAKVLQLFGKYVGTAREPGLRWANPLYMKQAVSVRIRNFESGQLKVNDSSGSPIEIAAVVVWKVVDTAEAVFEVDDYEQFVQIASALRKEIQARLDKAGVEVIEARISHLAYAPEIANAMLRRQQASAVIAARKQIVAGAVGMVQMALDELRQHDVLELDEERKAAMVSNLLVVLCGEENAQPVLNTGTLYT